MENDKAVTADPAHRAKVNGLPGELYTPDVEVGEYVDYFLPDKAPPGVHIVYAPVRVVVVGCKNVRKETVI